MAHGAKGIIKPESANLSKAIADSLWLIARSMAVLGQRGDNNGSEYCEQYCISRDVKLEIANAVDQDYSDSGHGAESNPPDQAARVLKFPETLSVKCYDHPHNNSNKGKPCLGYEMQVIIMSIERTACKPWRLVLGKYGCKIPRPDAEYRIIFNHLNSPSPS